MLDFRFLTKKEVFGSEQLDILKKYGKSCAITDFAILHGGFNLYSYISESKGLTTRVGYWWTKTQFYGDIYYVNNNGDYRTSCGCNRVVGGRPVIPYSDISLNVSNIIRRNDGILEVEFGEYPQTVVSEDCSIILEEEFFYKMLKKTGKIYTTDSAMYSGTLRYQDMDIPFKANTYAEYEYNGKKYIRFVSTSNSLRDVLSNGKNIQRNKVYWIEVEPIKWLIDEKTGLALSKKVVFAGVQFDKKNNYDGIFENSDIKRFMDVFFSREMLEDRFSYVNRRLDEIEDNFRVKKQLRSCIYLFIKDDLFDALNENDDKRDSFISYMNIIFDSDTYYEMYSKLKLLKRAIFTFDIGYEKGALKLLKEISSDKHKERINGKIIAFPTGCINRIEKPKKIIDRTKVLYSRIDNSFDDSCLDSIHDNAISLNDLCNKVNYYKLGKVDKRKVKSLFSK